MTGRGVRTSRDDPHMPTQRTAAAPHPGSLPTELTPFIGRDTELEELERLLGAGRLLTLTGAGGSGKTRLARELAEREDVSAGGVAWVELAALDDPALIPQHVAKECGIPDEVRGTDTLLAVLRARGGLLVLDNCEHLVDSCAELVDRLLRACPELRILATSREALGVKGERAWLVPPLSLPSGEAVDPEEAGSFEAVRLFVDRARDAMPEFTLTPQNTPAVVAVCRRLDGIPLAIELAAARVRVLPPEQLSQRLGDAFRVLTGGGRTAVPRHRTLRATMDWSHDLLRDASKVLFRRQAVFRGGFTLDAAEAVCAGDGVGPADVLDLVARLVDRSLLTVHEYGGFARYHALETVRQYALERLAGSGEEDAVRRRHAGYVLRIVEDAAAHANKPSRRAAFDALFLDMDNVRDALSWSREHDHPAHVRLAGQLGWFWFSVGHWAEARRWMEEALALPAAAEAGVDRARLLFAVAAVATLQADVVAARPWLEEAVGLAGRLGDEEIQAYALNYLGMTFIQQGQPEGGVHCQRAADWFRAHNDDYGLRLALLLLGMVAQMKGDREGAIRITQEAVDVARRFGQDRELSVSLQNMATIHFMQGEFLAAEPFLLEALEAARRDPSYFFIATTLDGLGEVRLRQGRIQEGGRIFGASESVRGTIAAQRFAIVRQRLDPFLEEVRAGEHGALFEAAREAGRTLRVEQILAEVLAPPAVDRAAEGDARVGAGRAPVGHAPRPGHPAPAGPAAAPAPAHPGGADLEVSALGPLEVVRRGEVLGPQAWAYSKPKELLLLLMLHPAGRTREQVGQALWPGASAAQVKNSFHVTLHHLRKTLGVQEWVGLDGDRYRLALSLSWTLDADRFDREARAALKDSNADSARLRSVLARYRGDLLEGEVVGAWVEEERDRLRRLMVDLGLALGAALEGQGDHADAAEVYHAIAGREELNEEAQRRLMVAWARAGDRVRALRHYERLVATLRDVLDADPEPETVRVYESLKTATAV
jgi:predicted ATPase/DNA-binding SARP family transcriptional activator